MTLEEKLDRLLKLAEAQEKRRLRAEALALLQHRLQTLRLLDQVLVQANPAHVPSDPPAWWFEEGA